MANTDLTQALTKGTLLIIEHGEYSDKSWQGPVRLLADYTKSDLSDQFLREWEHEDWPCANEFLPWLVRTGKAESVDNIHRWHVGSYSNFQP